MANKEIKELYKSGDWICVWKYKDTELNQTWRKDTSKKIDFANKNIRYELIHKSHEHILDAYLDGCETYEYSADKLNKTRSFIDYYTIARDYEAVPKSLENCYCEANELHKNMLKHVFETSNGKYLSVFEIGTNDKKYLSLDMSCSLKTGKKIQYNEQLEKWTYCPYEEKEDGKNSYKIHNELELETAKVGDVCDLNNFKDYCTCDSAGVNNTTNCCISCGKKHKPAWGEDIGNSSHSNDRTNKQLEKWTYCPYEKNINKNNHKNNQKQRKTSITPMDSNPTSINIDTNKITRVEVIGKNGSEFSKRLKDSFYKLDIQDDGKTIKLFETDLNQDKPKSNLPIFKKNKHGEVAKLEDERYSWVLKKEYSSSHCNMSILDSESFDQVWTDVPYDSERKLYHGQPVYINLLEEISIGFYDSKTDCILTGANSYAYDSCTSVNYIPLETLKTMPFVWDMYEKLFK